MIVFLTGIIWGYIIRKIWQDDMAMEKIEKSWQIQVRRTLGKLALCLAMFLSLWIASALQLLLI